MKFRDLYKGRYKGCIVTLTLFLTCLIVSVPTFFNNNLFYVLAICNKPKYIWQYFSGAFEHGIIPSWFLWVHMGLNFTMLFLFGLMIEKVLGSKKMLLISSISLLVFIIAVQNFLVSSEDFASGASGIFYSYGPISLYMIIKTIKSEPISIFKTPMLYIYLLEYILMWPLTALASPISTNTCHGLSALIGIVFIFIFKKDIDANLQELKLNNLQRKHNNQALYALWLLPISMACIVTYCLLYLV